MDYQTVKNKYAPQARERTSKIALADMRIASIEVKIEHYKGLQQPYNGIIEHHARKQYDDYSTKLRELKIELEAAELNKANVSINPEELDQIAKTLNL